MTFSHIPKIVSLQDFYDAFRLPGGTLPLDSEQQKAVEHVFTTPLWVIAGPGTGKTHTMVCLVLKRLLVDGVPPERVILTTFTRKAATELRTRLILARQQLVDAGLAAAAELDLSRLLLGTLHELASEVLQRERYSETLRVRLIADELTQQFFIRRTRNPLMKCDDLTFWQRFQMVKPSATFPPASAKRADGAGKLFNRMTENSVDLDLMRATGEPHFVLLADAYEHYLRALYGSHRTDQALLQRHFLNYLQSPEGQHWVGQGLTVLVDEYQDTNPIQEEIYFRLAGAQGDLTVVGDDDQSLYRFRGATVESLINFDAACQHYLGRTPVPLYLKENRRSHPGIVKWVNDYIGTPALPHPEMTDPVVRVRAPGKPPLVAKSVVTGTYPPVAAILESGNPAVAQKVVQLVTDLIAEGLVEDPSQIALLTFSTRESSQGVGAYTTALREAGLTVYNPRSRRAHLDERLLALLGALGTILNPDFDEADLPANLPRAVPEYIRKAERAFEDMIGGFPELEEYILDSREAIEQTPYDPDQPYLKRKGGQEIRLSTLFYKLLGHEPFHTDLQQADGGERFKALNLIMAEYEALFGDGKIKVVDDPGGTTKVDPWTLYNLYSIFVGGFHDGLNDPEDDEVTLQPGAANVMTIHQSKGLEFEVVIVLRPDKQPWASDTHELEDQFYPFSRSPTKPTHRRTQEERAAEDAIRLYFVAYSRAKRLLVLAGQFDKNCAADWDRVLGGRGVMQKRQDITSLGAHLI